MKLSDTRIPLGGVLRCCLETVAVEYENTDIEIGDKSKCTMCGELFTLVNDPSWDYPKWLPNWQLEKS